MEILALLGYLFYEIIANVVTRESVYCRFAVESVAEVRYKAAHLRIVVIDEICRTVTEIHSLQKFDVDVVDTLPTLRTKKHYLVVFGLLEVGQVVDYLGDKYLVVAACNYNYIGLGDIERGFQDSVAAIVKINWFCLIP